MKIGRNDPCPCGSGKKYKNCCLRKETMSIAECFFLSLGRDPKLPEIILNLTQCESRIRLIVKRFRAAQSRCHFFQASFCSRSEHDTDKQTHWRR